MQILDVPIPWRVTMLIDPSTVFSTLMQSRWRKSIGTSEKSMYVKIIKFAKFESYMLETGRRFVTGGHKLDSDHDLILMSILNLFNKAAYSSDHWKTNYAPWRFKNNGKFFQKWSNVIGIRPAFTFDFNRDKISEHAKACWHFNCSPWKGKSPFLS